MNKRTYYVIRHRHVEHAYRISNRPYPADLVIDHLRAETRSQASAIYYNRFLLPGGKWS